MALSFTLFLSGSPQDYEWLPQTDNHAKQVCEKYFNLPSTEIPHGSDFYVELFPADNYSYYTYLHRKAVNGMPREGAHIALTMRISGGYCNQPKAIYDLLEMVYMQYLDGKIIQRKGDGEVFLIPSLMAYETQRKQMEGALGQALQQLVAGTLQSFGKEISASRQQPSVLYYSADTDNEQLLRELRKTHKLRLIPSNENSAEKSSSLNSVIDQLKQQLTQKDGTIQQKDKELEQLNGKIKELETKTKANPVLPKKPIGTNSSSDAFQQTIFTQLADISKRIDSLSSNMGSGRNKNAKSIHQKNIGNKIIQYLPWVLFAVAITYIIIDGFKEPERSDVNTLQTPNVSSKSDLEALKDSVKAKDVEIQELRSQINELSNIVGANGNETSTTSTANQRTSQQQSPWIDVGGNDVRKFKAGKTYPLSILHHEGNGTFTADGVLSIVESNKLYCREKGKGTITAYDENGKEIAKRSINVVEQ